MRVTAYNIDVWSHMRYCKLHLPSHPADTNELGITASRIILGLSPFKSKLARQPSNPWRDWICFGNVDRISLGTPPEKNVYKCKLVVIISVLTLLIKRTESTS